MVAMVQVTGRCCGRCCDGGDRRLDISGDLANPWPAGGGQHQEHVALLFEEPAEYGELLAEVFSALNAPRQRRHEQELERLTPLPAFRFADYELLPVC